MLDEGLDGYLTSSVMKFSSPAITSILKNRNVCSILSNFVTTVLIFLCFCDIEVSANTDSRAYVKYHLTDYVFVGQEMVSEVEMGYDG